MRKTVLMLVCVLLLDGCASNKAGENIVEGPFRLKLTGGDRQNDEIIVSIEKGTPKLDVKSKSGIGRVEISPKNGEWKPFAMRLHLKSLESFEVDNRKIAVTACFLIRPSYQQLGELYKYGEPKSSVIKSDSKYWLAVKVVNTKEPGNNEIPLEEGYFEVTVPESLFEGNPETLYIQWIDYLRR